MKQAPPFRCRITALAVLGTIPALAGIIPVLDVCAEDSRVGIEDHHHPGTHGYAHDHLICIQHDANQWAPPPELPAAPAARTGRGQDPFHLWTAPDYERRVLSPRPRSPPLA